MRLRLPQILIALAVASSLAAFGAATASSRITTAGAGPLAVKHESLNFGGVHPGDARSRSTVLTNVSSDPVSLLAGWSTAVALDPGFGFPSCDSCLQAENEVLAPGASCTITFTFAPTGSGDASATFAFSTDGWASTAATETLRGKGL